MQGLRSKNTQTGAPVFEVCMRLSTFTMATEVSLCSASVAIDVHNIKLQNDVHLENRGIEVYPDAMLLAQIVSQPLHLRIHLEDGCNILLRFGANCCMVPLHSLCALFAVLQYSIAMCVSSCALWGSVLCMCVTVCQECNR